MDDVVRGDFQLKAPDGMALEIVSPNLIQVAGEDIAESAAMLPTVRVAPPKANQRAKEKAAQMERQCAVYLDHAQAETLMIDTNLDLVFAGYDVMTVMPDYEASLPLIEKRDPRGCYPEPGFKWNGVPQRCIFARNLQFSELPEDYQQILHETMAQEVMSPLLYNHKLTLVEYFDSDEIVVGCVLNRADFRTVEMGVILDRIPNKIGVCPVVIEQRISFDGEMRGQFDQSIGMVLALARLMSMVIDYADQSVYSDVWVKDLIGEMPWGGGGFIELGANGAIGRVPPAVSSLNVDRDLERLIDHFHLGARWPKSRPGTIDQAIASGKFVEATVGMMSTVIKSIHQAKTRGLAQVLRLCLATDKAYFPGEKTVSGRLRNREFLFEYSASDIDLSYKVAVEYGLGLGRDPSTSAVLAINLNKEGMLSKITAMEQTEGIMDVDREMRRIDVEKFREIMQAKLAMDIQQGMISDSQLVEMVKAREAGTDFVALFEEFIVKPQAAAPPQGALSSPPGMPPVPGGPPGPGGPAGPAGQGPGGLAPPPPPDVSQVLARLGAQVGPPGGGGLIGVSAGGRP